MQNKNKVNNLPLNLETENMKLNCITNIIVKA